MRRIAAAVVLLAVASTSGCVSAAWRSGGSVRRLRADCNSYREPALSLTSYDHLPSRTKDVRHFRWLHGADPVLPYPGEQLAKPAKTKRFNGSWVTRCRAIAGGLGGGDGVVAGGQTAGGAGGRCGSGAGCLPSGNAN